MSYNFCGIFILNSTLSYVICMTFGLVKARASVTSDKIECQTGMSNVNYDNVDILSILILHYNILYYKLRERKVKTLTRN